MLDKDLEPFSNPLAPSSNELRRESQKSQSEQPLTNEDFRKLMMTPRVVLQTPSSSGSASVRSDRSRPKQESENKKKKKRFYATLKKEEDDTLAELAKKYRDRARERRDNANPDYQEEVAATTTAAYRAVAPDLKSGLDAAERRKQMIQESKFLGGDMQHTHLVKGLDYALLQKVRSEIQIKENDETEKEIEDEDEFETITQKGKSKTNLPVVPDIPEESSDAVKSVMATNILRFAKTNFPERNELFLPGRMAYQFDLENECIEIDIPTTLIRSKADCPHLEISSSLSTNDIVINKLTQILSYLRQGGSSRKIKKVPKERTAEVKQEPRDEKTKKSTNFDDSIYGDIGDYVPEIPKRDIKKEGRERDRDRDRDHKSREKKHAYFEKGSEEERDSRRKDDRGRDAKSIAVSAVRGVIAGSSDDVRSKLTSKLPQDAPESYAECYPGAPENDDAVLDSDDEVDYSKMDLGNKKGLIGRWDFDTAEEYGDYMSKKEALPKAAFQYGVKMADGRKTRRVQGKKDDKAKIDRDWQKINAIISKRKTEAAEGGGTVTFHTPRIEHDHKRHKPY